METTVKILLSQKKLKNNSIDIGLSPRNSLINQIKTMKKEIILKRDYSNYRNICKGIYSLYDKINELRYKDINRQMNVLKKLNQNRQIEELSLFRTDLKNIKGFIKIPTKIKSNFIFSQHKVKPELNQIYNKSENVENLCFPRICINSITLKNQKN